MLYTTAILTLNYTDGSATAAPFSFDLPRQTVTDGVTRWTALRLGDEIEFTLNPLSEKKVRALTLSLTLKAPEALVLTNNMTTNGFAEVVPLAERLGKQELFREYVCLRSGEEELHLAFTTCDRLITYFRFGTDSLEAVQDLEDKPLPTEGLRLELLWLEQSMHALAFLDEYAARMDSRYRQRPDREIPTGWCSWSICYSHLDQQTVARVSDEMRDRYKAKGAKLIQLDDGWEHDGIFSGEWGPADTFPDGIDSISRKVREDGFDFGLWMSPNIWSLDGRMAKERGYLLRHEPDGSFSTTLDDRHGTLDLGNPAALDYLRSSFRQTNDYGAVYYKLDFLIFSLFRYWRGDFTRQFLYYEGGYAVELFRKAMSVIRETVGDRFLLSCGAPLAECFGIFDGMRAAPDITQLDADAPWFWDILRKCAANCAYRAPLHKKPLLLDPDAVLVREYDNHDGFAADWHEARLWVTACAFSGGSLLLNELPWKASEERLKLFERILPPIGIAGRPLDLYEQPQPSVLVIDCGKKKLAAVFNYTDTVRDMTLPLAAMGCVGEQAVVDAWEQKVLGAFEGKMPIPGMPPHSANVYLIQPKPETGAPLGTLDTLYMGVEQEEPEGECLLWR